jgi:hypothetical protein
MGGGVKAGLIPLNQQKRDMRSMEEIQAELRIKRAKLNGTYVEPVVEAKTRPTSEREYQKREMMIAQQQQQQVNIKRQQERKKFARRDDSRVGASSSTQQEPPRTWRRDDDYESRRPGAASSHQTAPPIKRRRSSSAPRRHQDEDLDEEYVKGNMSSIIGGMFGYNRNRFGNAVLTF